ncbi:MULTISPECIES: NAD/NADP-dependent octopine/nopaline dehydrogenase family protein [unclassified Bradyrhizobium]|uniref:NAD/NADP-dependent octopine/nopaline dehydrogenase family protein n=1 Tax=unclassified Bradyrhizobium TaxID=2631580 RepID=UPI001FFC0AA7|nr:MULTISPECIES: NAD/NADP-dependent octopine/nopaline dehydrogenase family protein [unclassified Bradyrhizobium]MCK1429276.1 NAD/NADP octopine/nopaline dehydrogenase family protein [Bradyrhizobium sp. 87]MCK1438393.1 NAD/NADP octopine/nopaline dehydrogenase family protein [Bradyrhizobium sp. 15]MCK1590128.1 NAD/NADP octopine/nopaline dehydrogenase family protein [Bradyrhizobium sp. 169]MCK1605397.1 NAD/NADP octopine/nopaline dehydrogenase family protein [Bradyrhizobium sp. 166]MCK1628510.1 NAD
MKIAVLGGGNGSFAAAGDFALSGHEVRLWRRDADQVAAHRAAGSRILVKDHNGRHDVKLALVTADIAEAVNGAELILCPAPAFAQTDIARLLAPHLRDGQVVFLPPATFGSMIFAQAARDAGNHAKACFAETGTLPWLTRKHGPFEVAITIRAKRLPVGVFPLDQAPRALEVIGQAFPGAIEPCGDALSGALMNAGPIIHPPLIVMNAGPIEHFEKWDIHKEGTQAAIRRVTDALDGERIAVREALGYGAPHFPLAHHYAKEGEIWMYGRGSHDRLTDSGDWRERIVLTEHRYMREDLRLGLSLLVSVAGLARVATPLAKAFLAIGGAVCGEDFAQGGRSLETLGLGNLDKTALQTLLRKGF